MVYYDVPKNVEEKYNKFARNFGELNDNNFDAVYKICNDELIRLMKELTELELIMCKRKQHE